MSKDKPLLMQAALQIAAGGSAGFVEVCLMHPLDLVKTRLQIQTKRGATAHNSVIIVEPLSSHSLKIISNLHYRHTTPVFWIALPKCTDKRDCGRCGKVSFHRFLQKPLNVPRNSCASNSTNDSSCLVEIRLQLW